jgi:cytochrome P450
LKEENLTAKDEIENYVMTEKELLSYSPYVTHHLPELWENPDVFNGLPGRPGKPQVCLTIF